MICTNSNNSDRIQNNTIIKMKMQMNTNRLMINRNSFNNSNPNNIKLDKTSIKINNIDEY